LDEADAIVTNPVGRKASEYPSRWGAPFGHVLWEGADSSTRTADWDVPSTGTLANKSLEQNHPGRDNGDIYAVTVQVPSLATPVNQLIGNVE
jgi:hypothetical protein